MFEKREELLNAVDHACFQLRHMAKDEVERRRPRLLQGIGFEDVYMVAVANAKKNSEGH